MIALPSAQCEPERYVVAVRTLCEFTAKAGDLDLRFTPSPTALEGINGHRVVAGRRGEHYLSELTLSGEFQGLTVRGRADGYDPQANRLDEVKTFRGDLAAMPDNHRALHWAQAKVYGWLLCQQLQLDGIELALVYFDVASERETLIHQQCNADGLRAFFEAQCQRFLSHARNELRHRHALHASLATLSFPHARFRSGQRLLAETVYKAVSTGRCLAAQAPTGIGKTLATLFPVLKAMPRQGLDRVLFLTAKTPGRRLALDALATLRRHDTTLPVRVLELVARDKACEFPENACNGESCPLARGFYDRLPAAREEALSIAWLDRAALRDVALQHDVCPYYLSQELARWADVTVADYNYWFDASALLFGLAQLNQWRVATLVDEAHNLVDRARTMYSAGLDQRILDRVREAAPAALEKPLQRLHRQWNALHREQAVEYQAYAELPSTFLGSLQQCIASFGEFFNEQPHAARGDLQGFYFECLQFARAAEWFDEHYLFDITVNGEGRRRRSRLFLRNVVPAGFIAPRLAATHCTVLFSATLTPRRYYADLLGLPGNTAWLDVPSPFDRAQLEVRIAGHISTRYSHRQASLLPITRLIAEQFQARPGNYLAFFSSFDYLQQVADLLEAEHPSVPLWRQARGMAEAEREAFIARFGEGGQGVGFAVLGGAFGEGVDLPGDRLIGAFIATLGLAQLNPVNEQFKQRMARLFGSGYDYTYLYPGLQKVVQAAGRVIRGQDDRGTVVLIDDRFAEARIRQLLPSWWQV